MKYSATLFLSIIILAFSGNRLASQNIPDSGTFGLTASVQNGQANLEFPYRISDNVSLAPVIGIQSVEDNFTQLQLGIKPRFFQNVGSDFGAFLGGQGILTFTDPNIGDNDTDLLLGAIGGGKYYLNNHFSFGVEGQLNLTLENNNTLSTRTAVTATYYF